MAKSHRMRSSAHSCAMNSNILHHFIVVLIEKSSVFHYNELYVTVWQCWTVVYSRQMKSVVSIAPAAAAKRHISLCGCVHNFILSGQFFDRQYKELFRNKMCSLRRIFLRECISKNVGVAGYGEAF